MKILLVEDEPHVASSLKLGGLGAEGFIVVHAATGTEGLWEATEKNHFDVIVLDIMVPELSGYEVLRRLRARSVWTPPVLMLTAKDGEYDQADAFALGGADDYLVKPFSFVVFGCSAACAGAPRRAGAAGCDDCRRSHTRSRTPCG